MKKKVTKVGESKTKANGKYETIEEIWVEDEDGEKEVNEQPSKHQKKKK